MQNSCGIQITSRSARCTFVALLFMAGLASGCASEELDEAAAFADIAITFEAVVPPLMSESFNAAVAADNLNLIQARSTALRGAGADPDTVKKLLRTQVEGANEDMRERLVLFAEFEQHATLLEDFFGAMKVLASSDSGGGISQSVSSVVTQADGLATIISGSGFLKSGGDAVKAILENGVQVVVANIKANALRDVLLTHGDKMHRSLAIQEAFLARLREQMIADMQNVQKDRERRLVVAPFVNLDTLPADWPAQRLAALRAHIDISAVSAAERSARKVRLAFLELTQNKLNTATVERIFQEVTKIVTVVQNLQSANRKGVE